LHGRDAASALLGTFWIAWIQDADYALFGMSKDLFRKRHPELDEDQLHKFFDKHDSDSNDKLFRDEYSRAVRAIKSEV
jgi:hypothetical protein